MYLRSTEIFTRIAHAEHKQCNTEKINSGPWYVLRLAASFTRGQFNLQRDFYVFYVTLIDKEIFDEGRDFFKLKEFQSVIRLIKSF